MSKETEITLVLVDIRSAHNVGSIFRSCDGFRAKLFLVGITPQPIGDVDNRLPHIAAKAHSMIAKTALGAEESVQWLYYADLRSCIMELKKENYRIIAVEQAIKSIPMPELTAHDGQKVALLLGREVEGLSHEEIELCEQVYEIPMAGTKESLNVSVAAAIALYQIRNCTAE